MANNPEVAPGDDDAPGDVSMQQDNPPFVPDPIQTEAVTYLVVNTLLDVPAIKKFADRIAGETGALVRAASLKRLAIERLVGKYRSQLGSVRFDAKGDVKATSSDYSPTDDETKAIKDAWKLVKWPTTLPYLWTGKDLPRNDPRMPWSKADPANVYVCWDKKKEYIQCVEERRYLPDGSKIVFIWSYFTDQIWRISEPDGNLPLFGLEKLDGAASVIVHEGPKAARAMQLLVEDDGARCPNGGWLKHPWGRELHTGAKVAHVGWLGGAERATDTDWRPLVESGAQIIVVADNEAQGKDAIGPISEQMKVKMRALFFTDQWPRGFDLADEFPDDLFEDRGGRREYIGPRFEDCLRPATWATDVLETGRPGARPCVPRREFVEEWTRSTSPPLYFHRDTPTRGLTADEFNKQQRAFSNTDNTARLLDQRPSTGVDGVTYAPGKPEGVLIEKDGRRVIQTWRDASIKPVAGSAWPLLRFLTHLAPVKEDRFHLCQWVATHIARPGIRMQHGIIMRSQTQGTGKTTLATILADQSGPHNYSMPSEQTIAESKYNSFLAYKRLVICNEFYSNQSFRTYNKIKTYITDAEVEVEIKYRDAHTIPATAHFYLCSNEKVPILLDERDRRFFIPTITERKLPKEYWVKFYAWLDGEGRGIIRKWAIDFVEKHGPVMPADDAPMSGAKMAMVKRSRSEEMVTVQDLAEHWFEAGRDDPSKRFILPFDELRSWLLEQNFHGRKRMGGPAIQDLLRAAGLTVRARDDSAGTDDRISINGRKRVVILNFKPHPGSKWPELIANFHKTMGDLITM